MRIFFTANIARIESTGTIAEVSCEAHVTSPTAQSKCDLYKVAISTLVSICIPVLWQNFPLALIRVGGTVCGDKHPRTSDLSPAARDRAIQKIF